MNAVERIYRQLGLSCHGTYEAVSNNGQTPNTTSGKAILQMLRKPDYSPVNRGEQIIEPTDTSASSSRILDLLRNEFNQPQGPAPPPPVVSSTEEASLTNAWTPYQARDSVALGAPSTGQRGFDGEQVVINRSELREKIREILSSDRFIDQIVDHIVLRSSY